MSRAGPPRELVDLELLRRCRLICFDNDGTLFASHEVANPAIQREYLRFCAQHGVMSPAPTDDEICRLTGKPGPVFYSEILPEPLRERAPEFRELCLQAEAEEVLARGRLYPGVEELLLSLRRAGRKLALVTNAGERYLDAVRRRVGYDRLLDGIYHFGRDGRTSKAEMIRAAKRDFQTRDVVMVGDRASDLEGARAAGAIFIGCAYGYGDLQEIVGADRLAHDVIELREILLGTPAGEREAPPARPAGGPAANDGRP